MKLRGRLDGLLWAVGSMAVVAILVLSPTIVQLGVIALAVLTFVAFVIPFRVAVLLWGALLPIWSIGPLPPLAFDGARIALALMILIKAGKSPGPTLFTRKVLYLVVPLSFVAIVLIILGAVRPDAQSLTAGGTMLLGIAVSSVVIARVKDPWPLFNGYLVGATASALVLIATAFGFSVLTPQTALAAGFFRLTGLSPSATLVTYQLAIGAAIAWGAFSRKSRRGWYVLSMIVCLIALAMSGGRGGVLALGLAVVVAVRWRWLRPLPIILLAGLGWLGLTIAENMHLTVNTIQRLIDSAQSGESDGRVGLITEGINEVLQQPIAGPGLDVFRAHTGLVPHVAILTFFVAGGILCGLIIVWATLSLIGRVVFVSPKPFGPAGKTAYLVLSIMIVYIFLEPSGPFVGTEFIALMFACVGVTSQRVADGLTEPDPAVARAASPRALTGVQRR